jgi:hypothetical protein
LETKVEVATINFDARIAALESQGLEARPSTGLHQPKLPTAAVLAMAPAMTSGHKGNEDADFISLDDDTIDVTARTRVAYAIARECNSFLHVGPSGSQLQPTITPQCGRSPIPNPYNALIAAPSNLSKYSDPEYFDNWVAAPSNLSKYSDPEYFDNRFTSTKSLRQTTIPKSFGHSERLANSNQEDSNRCSGDSVQGNRGDSRGSRQVVGGPIISPPDCDRAMHACTLSASHFDIIRLATKAHHGGMDGVVNLTKEAIRACGYGQVKATAEDVVVCYNDIPTHTPPIHNLPTPLSLPKTSQPTTSHSCLRSSADLPPPPYRQTHNPPETPHSFDGPKTTVLPPPEPPPCAAPPFPPDLLFDVFSRPASPTSTAIDLRAHQEMESVLTQLPTLPSLHDSITHVVCTPCVCGIRGDSSSIRTCITDQKATKMINSGSYVCVTGNLGLLLDLFKISIALKGEPSSFDNCITKQGLLPLSLFDGTTYY